MFEGNIGDTANRSWNGFASGDRTYRSDPSDHLLGRMPAALRGDRRSPRVDIISGAGTITYEPMAEGAPGR
jgi:hypothetical protein